MGPLLLLQVSELCKGEGSEGVEFQESRNIAPQFFLTLAALVQLPLEGHQGD